MYLRNNSKTNGSAFLRKEIKIRYCMQLLACAGTLLFIWSVIRYQISASKCQSAVCSHYMKSYLTKLFSEKDDEEVFNNKAALVE